MHAGRSTDEARRTTAVSVPDRSRRLEQLSELVEAVESGGEDVAPGGVSTGWDAIDRTLAVRTRHGLVPGLARGTVHEWFGDDGAGRGSPSRPRAGPGATPLLVLMHLARRALEADRTGGRVLWIGRAAWPFASALRRMAGSDRSDLLDRSVLIDPCGDADRLWAIDLVARSRATSAVVADGRGLDVSHVRRLQLAAGSGRALVLLSRPAADLGRLSTAGTRWIVRPIPSERAAPCWSLHLVRCKGRQRFTAPDAAPVTAHQRVWNVEWDHATGLVHHAAGMADRSRPAASARATPSERRAALSRAG